MKWIYLLSILVFIAMSAIVVAQDTEVLRVTVIVTDEAIEFPEEIPAGLVNLNFENNRSEASFEGGVARLNDDVTFEEFMEAASAENPMEAVALVSLYGGTGIGPGETVDYTINLIAGNYLLLEFSQAGPEGFDQFTVTENDTAAIAEPEADVNLAMVDFGFGVPAFIPAGEQVWHLENVADQWHETIIIRLPEGVTSVADMRAAMEAGNNEEVPPALYWGAMSPETEVWITLDLEPGNYGILCFLPDLTGDFSPHMNHGMVQVFTVQASE